jgi:hypothetical protein
MHYATFEAHIMNSLACPKSAARSIRTNTRALGETYGHSTRRSPFRNSGSLIAQRAETRSVPAPPEGEPIAKRAKRFQDCGDLLLVNSKLLGPLVGALEMALFPGLKAAYQFGCIASEYKGVMRSRTLVGSPAVSTICFATSSQAPPTIAASFWTRLTVDAPLNPTSSANACQSARLKSGAMKRPASRPTMSWGETFSR